MHRDSLFHPAADPFPLPSRPENGVPVLTGTADVHDLSDCPSPYQMGLLDGILEKYPEMDFSAILETNRGCPYHCAFCEWCQQESKISSFS